MGVFKDIKTGLSQAIEQEKIDKIAKDICSKYTICTCDNKNGKCSVPQQHARIMYELGYRKQDEIVKEILDKVKEALEPTISALFIVGETLVEESKSHISQEKALDNIRGNLSGTIFSRYRLAKILEGIEREYSNDNK